MRLIDCFVRLIAYAALLVRSDPASQPDYETVKRDIRRLIEQSEICVTEGTVNRADYDLARFAVFAWIDEAILSSQWEGKRQWQRELLQRQYYQTADAGEGFFDRLNQVGLHQRDIREVYYICLAMGFTGQFGNQEDTVLLEGLKSENLKILTGSSVGVPALNQQTLFPDAYAAPSAPSQIALSKNKRVSPTVMVCIAAPVLLYAVLFLIYRFVLSNIGDSFIQAVS